MSSIPKPVEPYRIKVVERIRRTTPAQREAVLRRAGFNPFNIPSDKVFIDLLTDSGTSAMSDLQWGALMVGDESYAGARSFFRFEKAVRNIFGFPHVIPTHQGRAAERVLFEAMVKKGQSVPNNIHFDTTMANVEVRDARAVNLVNDGAYDADSLAPFKGNMDIGKLEKALEGDARGNVPLVMMTITNNSGGGQPVSMANIREVSAVCRRRGVPFFFDACRFAENAYFIKKREPGYARRSILSIAREMFGLADGATMSAKKDALVNIGGFLTFRDDALAGRVKNILVIGEGFPTYGGLAGRDLEAVARGLEEVLDEAYLEHRTGQVAYLARMLDEASIPVFKPVGGHAVYLLADRFLPHIPRGEFPGWALTIALYRQAGIRAVEIGGVMFGKIDPKTGLETYPKLELVRLAIPRRVYTASHLDVVAEALVEVHRRRDRIKGMRIVEQPKHLRHFSARLEELV
jgi:tyrosine phenol-lyase